MRGIGFAPAAEPREGYAAPTCTVRGGARSALVSFDGFPLWALAGVLDAGTALTWDEGHGDEGVYVVDGSLHVEGRACPAGGAVIVEGQAPAVVAAPAGATVVHFGPVGAEPPADGHYGPPAPPPHAVHVVGPGGVYAAVEPGRDTRMFADSSCPTCRITLFSTGRDEPYVSARHSHSADEILYVLRGEVRFGSRRLGPGDAVAIVGGHRYGFRSGPDGFAFLNYRRDASSQTTEGDVPRLEGGRARGLTFVNDVR
jgi:mannose-6-phosphate isomerase-like protein (cupin superfamily)